MGYILIHSSQTERVRIGFFKHEFALWLRGFLERHKKDPAVVPGEIRKKLEASKEYPTADDLTELLVHIPWETINRTTNASDRELSFELGVWYRNKLDSKQATVLFHFQKCDGSGWTQVKSLLKARTKYKDYVEKCTPWPVKPTGPAKNPILSHMCCCKNEADKNAAGNKVKK